jgi:hypothetical protein
LFDVFDATNENNILTTSRQIFWTSLHSFITQFDETPLEFGLLSDYPSFVDIILNHLEDSTIFLTAVKCFSFLLTSLADKLWAYSSFTPTQVLQKVIKQCFILQDKESHLHILELFLNYLASLQLTGLNAMF